ncbi:conserved hypothetical protein [Methanocaldococcus vulcanius M7]|uniref:Uncharacterized protein n=1 Tax=Methanocaldococcus vulcanius (strain ATCC 700851 / DSM 12094 / M7) TaxID=579137 RepID=C9RHM3_METVM|nr:hypothetical protein [Methanocaldococcus vulcanius]ACX73075.1 conserved hypothetical protein [Methanocaldococcus vulcanius M7]
MKLRIICKDDNFTDDELCIKCELCVGKDLITIIKMMNEEYDIDEVIIPDCQTLKRVLNP